MGAMNVKPLTELWFRLAYVTPHPVIDNVAYQFYRIAPDGVMLMLASLWAALHAAGRGLPVSGQGILLASSTSKSA